jgi:hypothetical protein
VQNFVEKKTRFKNSAQHGITKIETGATFGGERKPCHSAGCQNQRDRPVTSRNLSNLAIGFNTPMQSI